MEVFQTVVAGATIFVLGQVVIRFLLDPIRAYRELVGRVAHAIVLHSTANYGHVPGTDRQLVSPTPPEEAIRTFRSLAGELSQCTYAIPCYSLFVLLHLIPSRANIQLAAQNLIGMSNSVGHLQNSQADRQGVIRRALRIYDPDRP